jgi:hypothetical protein
MPVSETHIYLPTGDARGGHRLDIEIYCDAPPPAQPTTDFIDLELSDSDTVVDCDEACMANYLPKESPPDSHRYQVIWRLINQTNSAWTTSFYLQSPNDVGYSTNGVEVVGRLPSLSFFSYTTGQYQDGFTNDVSYTIPGASSFDWVSADPTYVSDAVYWDRSPEAAKTGQWFSASNHSASQQDSTDTFIAGAFVGVAGGALIAVLQEALDAHRPRRKLRRVWSAGLHLDRLGLRAVGGTHRRRGARIARPMGRRSLRGGLSAPGGRRRRPRGGGRRAG